MNLLADITIADPIWIWPAAGTLIAAGFVLLHTYRHTPALGSMRPLAIGLKTAGFILLAMCLIDPLWSGQSVKPGANLLAIMADNSQGMQLQDGPTTRLAALQTALDETPHGWIQKLDETFQVRRYLFDSQLRRVDDFQPLDGTGRASQLGGMLSALAHRYEQRPLAGVILLTDGIATDTTAQPLSVEGLPPIYPVVIGSENHLTDLSLQRVTVSQTPFEDAPVTITADVAAHGLNQKVIQAQLLDEKNVVIETQSLTASAADDQLGFRFKVRPSDPALHFYRVRVSAQDTAIQEVTLANNTRLATVDRGGGPYRILYVSGRPNWEYKFLRRAIEADERTQLVALIRMAEREPRFAWRGRTGESNNPLFRGFDRKDEEAERHDQPVLIRLDTEDALELSDGFPADPKALYRYDGLILDDVDAKFFTADQLMLIERYVSERGGGLLMLGGAESFQAGRYGVTPLARVLPVYLDRAVARAPGPIRWDLTRDGWLQPWLRLRDQEQTERERLSQMPDFKVINAVQSIKPGARVLATATDTQGQTFPALAIHRYGAGRSAALLLGDLWRWGMRDEAKQKDLGQLWRQTLRWLITDTPPRVAFTAEQDPEQPDTTRILRTRVRQPDFSPMDGVHVAITILEPDGSQVMMSAEPSLTEPGVFETRYTPHTSGGYHATAQVTDTEEKPVARVEAGWTLNLEADEMRQVQPDHALLADLARRSGGKLITVDDLSDLADQLPKQSAPVTEITTTPLWHGSTLFILAMICFAAEWTLRRTRGLP